jgi:hypothetical protein
LDRLGTEVKSECALDLYIGIVLEHAEHARSVVTVEILQPNASSRAPPVHALASRPLATRNQALNRAWCSPSARTRHLDI